MTFEELEMFKGHPVLGFEEYHQALHPRTMALRRVIENAKGIFLHPIETIKKMFSPELDILRGNLKGKKITSLQFNKLSERYQFYGLTGKLTLPNNLVGLYVYLYYIVIHRLNESLGVTVHLFGKGNSKPAIDIVQAINTKKIIPDREYDLKDYEVHLVSVKSNKVTLVYINNTTKELTLSTGIVNPSFSKKFTLSEIEVDELISSMELVEMYTESKTKDTDVKMIEKLIKELKSAVDIIDKQDLNSNVSKQVMSAMRDINTLITIASKMKGWLVEIDSLNKQLAGIVIDEFKKEKNEE